jgi:hypothetical protein
MAPGSGKDRPPLSVFLLPVLTIVVMLGIIAIGFVPGR